MKKALERIVATLEGINKRLTALEKSKSQPKSSTKSSTKKEAKKETIYYDITKSDKVNRRSLKSLERSYYYNRERYGKAFNESFKTFKDFKKTLDSLGFIKTRDRVYYSQREYDKLKEAQK